MTEHDATNAPDTATWSTQTVDPDDAIDYWREVRGEVYVDADMAKRPESCFNIKSAIIICRPAMKKVVVGLG